MRLKEIKEMPLPGSARVAVLILLIIWAVVTSRSLDAYTKGLDAQANGKMLAAITLFERSALWYAPLNPFAQRSLDKLEGIERQLKRGRPHFSRQAGNAVDRVVGQIDPWNRLGVKAARQVKSNLQLPYRLLIQVAFIGWLAASVAFCFAGFGEDGTLRGKRAAGYLSGSFLLLGVWLYLLAL